MSKLKAYAHVYSNKEFISHYKKVGVRIRIAFDKKLKIFQQNAQEPELRNHPLRNKWKGYRSIDITADYRVIYKEVKEGKEINAYLVALGTHKELYS